MHATTGHWKIGLALALTTSVLWGVLPIALTVVLRGMDPFTITWYRFLTASLVLGLILAATNSLPKFEGLNRRAWLLLLVAAAGLTGNYVLYVSALPFSSPTTSQIVTQLGPIFLLLGGLVLFKEKFAALQWAGFAVLICGLLLFFNDRLAELIHPSAGLGLGVAMLVCGMIAWAAYGLAQKQLLAWLGAQQILLLLYLGAFLALLPLATFRLILRLNGQQFFMLAFCCMNTLVAYGAFAEALRRWEVSRIGAILSTSPVFTVAAMAILGRVAPALIVPERLNFISMIGTLLVVSGSATCALARRAS